MKINSLKHMREYERGKVNFNAFLWEILKHVGILIVGSIFYMLSFHISVLDVSGIYFYDGIIRLAVVSLVVGIFIYILRVKINFDGKDVCLAMTLFLLLNMLWLSLCIVSLDRSLSVFLLCYMEEYPGGMDEEQVDKVFQEVFVERYGMLERRFEEQIKSGNILYKDKSYKLTKRGELFVNIFKCCGKLYNVDERFIEPQIEETVEHDSDEEKFRY